MMDGAVLERVHAWTAETRSLFVALPAPLRFQPGQFVSLELPVGERPPLVRAYSIASSPEEPGTLELCVDRVSGGPGSTYLFGLGAGARLTVKGPFGSFRLDEPPPAPLVFLAEGTGIAPIRPMVRRALARRGAHAVHVVHVARAERALLFRDEHARLAEADPRLCWEPLVSADPDATLARLVEARWVGGDAERGRHFWICGVGAIVHRLRDLLRAAGYARRAVHAERW